MTFGLRVELRHDVNALEDLAIDWKRLWCSQPRREVFTSWAWSMAYWRAAATPRRPRIVIVRRDDRTVGLLPLAIGSDGVRFLSGPHADYNDILVDDPDAVGVVAAALGACGPCRLESIPEWSQLSRALPQLPASVRARVSVAFGTPCPALRLRDPSDALLSEMVSKKSLKRHEKKLARHGTIELHHLDDREQIHGFLDDFYSQHITRRAVAGQRSLFLDRTLRRFYAEMVDCLDPAAELRFARLTVNGVAVGYHFGFELDGRYTWYKPSFDINYWDCGVGEVLLKRLLEAMPSRGAVEFDFTRGDEAFKQRFANHQGYNVTWSVCASAAAARAVQAKTAVVAALKARPKVVALRERILRAVLPPPGPIDERNDSQRLSWKQILLRRDERWLFVAPIDEVISSSRRSLGGEVKRVSLREAALLAAEAGLSLSPFPRWRAIHTEHDKLYVLVSSSGAPLLIRLGLTRAVDASFDEPYSASVESASSPVDATAQAGQASPYSKRPSRWSATSDAVPELPGPEWMVEFAYSGLPVKDQLVALIAAVLLDAEVSGEVWIACPSNATSLQTELTASGFVRYWRCVRSQWLGGAMRLRYQAM